MAFSVAGGQSFGVAYVLDGAMHNNPYDNLNLPLPFPDALQEFKVETSTLPANYGNHPGGAVNAVTKSGTNGIHGDAFEQAEHSKRTGSAHAPTRRAEHVRRGPGAHVRRAT